MMERPILFNSEMVRAILDGKKTQTRRVVKQATEDLIRCHAGDAGQEDAVSFTYNNYLDDDRHEHGPEWLVYAEECPKEGVVPLGQCPYGKPGDRLWVRETFADEGCRQDRNDCYYRADGESDLQGGPWTPSIHMPRWASRILLEVTAVRVERLQEISEDDCDAEGVNGEAEAAAAGLPWHDNPRRAFRFLWKPINGPDSWDANPWVWVVEFKRIDGGEVAA